MLSQATYIWMDGTKPTQKLRSKMRIIPLADNKQVDISDFPDWGFDGSSTYQAEGHFSDLVLKPARFVPNPLGEFDDYLVLCEVYNTDGTPHVTNTRANLRKVMEEKGDAEDFWMGFEQEYTLFKGYRPIGWPDRGFPAPQGPFYCGVGADEVFGRDMVDDHTQACIDAGLMIFGTNAEVMPGQWEFQMGYRGVDSESADPLTVADHLWIARWLLYRIGEDYGVIAKLDNKPISGDWNGAGQHTNISTKAMRDPATGEATIEKAIKALEKNHMQHIKEYGADLETRLTGMHETAPIDQFSAGVSDRGASIRIPPSVKEKGCGYIEDRRPGANADPYRIARALVDTICD
jgi:glutamine synthetase